ncbi:MAG TPA: polyprenyl synthetase family protein [Bacteroidales bacterium]|nr:polyprenyl synthetase family protein [Bacteroidales bacterium]
MYNREQLKEIIEKAIAGLQYTKEAEKLTDPVKYVLSIGGKRLRPVITLMSCNLFRDKIDEAVMPAAGVEVFHNFTLVHDDIMDNAPLRRSLPTVHTKWSLNQAVLSGDVMAFIANDCFLQAPSRCMAEVFRIYNKAAIEVCAGQQLDMDFEKAAAITEPDYIRMIGLKTAVLIAAAARIGGVIGGAAEKDCEYLYRFGLNLGLAFQFQDDLLDIYGDVNVFGKVLGGDIVANKKTFLFVCALEKGSWKQQKRLHELFTMPNADPRSKVREVMKIYEEINVKEAAELKVKDYVGKAFGYLEKTDVPPERKQELTRLANNMIGREK